MRLHASPIVEATLWAKEREALFQLVPVYNAFFAAAWPVVSLLLYSKYLARLLLGPILQLAKTSWVQSYRKNGTLLTALTYRFVETLS